MNIRILNKNDVNEFRELRLKGLKTDATAFGSTYERENGFTLEKFKTRLEESDSKFVVGGFDDGSLVCIATFIRKDGEKDKHKSMLVGMYCSKEYRGTGIAKNVVEFILEKARNLEGLKIINLMVVSENLRAKAFYESFGFKNMVLNQNLCLMNLNIMMKI
ncbi:GNAT family N-acetyltransferase (plasmid) [Staphylococcus aureus]|nr:GNAT family N-acetyltransferase [Staphylococcus aureus]WRN39640.1 GNAT family N-acetyltransferase [Staphylococcus aureus]